LRCKGPRSRLCAYFRQKWIDLRQAKTKMILHISSDTFHRRKCLCYLSVIIIPEGLSGRLVVYLLVCLVYSRQPTFFSFHPRIFDSSITSSQSPPSLSPSRPITPSIFHSRLKTHLFHKSFPP